MHYQSNISPARRAVSYFCAFLMFLVSLLPALALATQITLPPNSTQNLGTAPINRQGELFADSLFSSSGLIIDDPNISRYFNGYSVDLVAGTAYTFRLSNFEFNALWFVTDNVGNILLSSVDAMSVEEAQELRLTAPVTDTFNVIISSALGTETGTYTLTINTLPSPSTITGRVVNTLNQPLPEIIVTAYRQVTVGGDIDFVSEFSTVTDINGNFSLSPLVSGNYKVSFFDLNLLYGAIYYNQAQYFDDADVITALPDVQTTLTDTVLEQGASIAGTVTDLNNNPLEDILVSAYTFTSGVAINHRSVETDTSGEFALTGLTSGNYFVKFSCMDGLYLTQYFNNASNIEAATAIAAQVGIAALGIDAQLIPASTISGTVRSNTSVPVEDIVVSLLRTRSGITAPTTLDCFEIVTQDITADDGTYFFGSLDSDTYLLHFSDPEGRFLDLFYEDAFVPARAGPIELVRPNHLVGKDVNLVRPATLSGTVTDTNLNLLSGITVRLFNIENAPTPFPQDFLDNPTFETDTDDIGNFTFTGLFPGNFILEFSDETGRHSTLYHLNQTDPNLANAITINPGTNLTNHNATLRAASTITGTVVDEITGLLLSGASVLLFCPNDTSTPLAQTTANSEGSFTFGGLDEGSYIIGFAPLGSQIPQSLQFYSGAFDIEDATPITLGHGELLDLDHLYWRPLPTVTLTLDAQNNTTPQRITHPQNSYLNTLPTPTFTGHRFEGWFTQSTGGTRVIAPLALTSDLTLFAQWRPADFIFTFDSRGGSAQSQQFFYFGDRVGTLPTPIRAGHTFQGWFDRPVAGFRVNTGDIVTRSMTLYAQWRPTSHTISFNSHGGSAVSSTTRNFGQTLGTLPTPNRQFHTFQGWFSTSTGGVRITSTHTVTQNMTLHARWTPQMVTVRFDTQGGRAIPSQSRQAGTRLGQLPTPTRNNRVFARWTTDRAGNNRVGANTRITNNMTLFAQWRSSDARLRGISRSAGTLNRTFSPNRLNYRLNLRANTSSVRITPRPRCDAARIAMRTSSNRSFTNRSSINVSVQRGSSRTLQIRVTSEDGRNRHIYRVTIRRAR